MRKSKDKEVEKMSINIGLRQDTSYLFSGLSKSSGTTGNLSWLGDYASIKNGSYGKLMKAYYSESGSSSTVGALAKKSASRTNSEMLSAKTDLSKADSAADSLKSSADALLKKGTDSVFAKEDKDAVYDAVSSFVKNYNDTVKTAGSVSDKSVSSRLSSLTGIASASAKQLAGIGITVQDDKTLSLDKDAFQKADVSKVQSLFQENGSFGYRTSVQAGLLSSAAEKAVSSFGTYSSTGQQNYSTGNLFNYFM